MKLSEDIQTLPIEINVSRSLTRRTSFLYKRWWWNWRTIWSEERYSSTKSRHHWNSHNNPVNLYKSDKTTTRDTNPTAENKSIIIEQSKDAVLQQLKAKLLHEEFSENGLQQDARYRHYAKNLERIVVKEDILTRQYFDETGNVKHHQILLPQHLLQELLQSLHGTAHRHPGISKMLPEVRQMYYNPSMAKHVKRCVKGCEQCAKNKRLPNATITPELLNLPEWDLGPEDAMQIDLLPILSPSAINENVLTAIDVFSRYLFLILLRIHRRTV